MFSFFKSDYGEPVRSGEYGNFEVVSLTKVIKKLLHVFDAGSVPFSVFAVSFKYLSIQENVVTYYERIFCADLFSCFKKFPVMALGCIYEYEIELL